MKHPATSFISTAIAAIARPGAALGLALLSLTVQAEEIKSPNGQLTLSFDVQQGGVPTYRLSYKGREVIKTSKLGLELKNNSSLLAGFAQTDKQTKAIDETWTPVWGESKTIRNH